MSEFRFGKATDVGRVRNANQDRYFGDGSVFAVADGMGGHSGGEIASKLAVEALADRVRLAELADLVTLVHQANERIVETARDDPSLRGMGTTLSVLAALDGDEGEARLGIANVGDSRVYRLDDGGLEQITEDHSLVEALVRDGRLSPEEAGRHPQRNILTRALGIDEKVLVDGWEMRAVAGDRYLLCSDGLFNELTTEEISAAFAESDDPQATADRLVADACDAGGRDNVTAVVVHVETGGADPGDDQRIVTVRRAVPDSAWFPATDEASAPEREGAADPEGDEPNSQADEAAVEPDRRRPRGRISWRLALLAGAIVVVIVLAVTAVTAWARSSYYVGVDGEEVVIFQGRPGGVLWLDPIVEEPVNVGVVELEPSDLDAVEAGVEFGDIGEAREFGLRLALRVRAAG